MSYTLLQENRRLSRKAHRCIWCPEPIEERSEYWDVRSVYGGELQANKFHPECYEAMHRAAHEEGGEIEIEEHSYGRGSTGPAGGYAR